MAAMVVITTPLETFHDRLHARFAEDPVTLLKDHFMDLSRDTLRQIALAGNNAKSPVVLYMSSKKALRGELHAQIEHDRHVLAHNVQHLRDKVIHDITRKKLHHCDCSMERHFAVIC